MDTEFPTTRIKKNGLNDSMNSRQKYCRKWELYFPWLKADKVDESLGICVICDKRLVCKKSHLERHQSSFKHQRMSDGTDDVDTKTSENFAVFLECDAGKPDVNYESNDFDTLELEDYTDDLLDNIKVENRENNRLTSQEQKRPLEQTITHVKPKEKLSRSILLERIVKDRKDINDYHYTWQKLTQPNNASYVTTPQRDSFDLFFDSVSASVKNLPPKFAYEIKSKISQLLTEYELRSLSEKEQFETVK